MIASGARELTPAATATIVTAIKQHARAIEMLAGFK
jgi:hypothetical protein